MNKELSELLKKYVGIFVNEYVDYLSSDQLEILRSIDYEHIISFSDVTRPFGKISLGKIVLSNANEALIKNLTSMPEYNKAKYRLNNKNMSSYLKYMCENGYDLKSYLNDLLMYFVFFLVIKNPSPFIYGLINQEIRYLGMKYGIRCPYLYAKEDFIISKMAPIIKIEGLRRILFMDRVSAFKYLNENYGFRYANFVEDMSKLLKEQYQKVEEKDYSGFEGFLNYTEDYDSIMYTDAYNCLLDFKARNGINY